MNFKKVSVIIPIYNSINTLEESLVSVINQTYPNIEVIIVDDHSKDGSFELAKKFESESIKVVKNPKKGACAARNYGFSLSNGDLIQFLDADDLIGPQKIKSQMDVLNGMDEGIVAIGLWGRFNNSKEEVFWENQKINKNFNPAYKWLLESWKGHGMGQTAIWLTPRKLIEKAGGWNEELKINQDGEFFSRVLMLASCVVFCDNAKVYYRSGNTESISQKNRFGKEKAESLLLSYQLYKKYALENAILEELRKGLGQNFLMFIYQFYGKFDDLVFTAEHEFYSLGYEKMWTVGGGRFKKLASVIGFKRALKLRGILKK